MFGRARQQQIQIEHLQTQNARLEGLVGLLAERAGVSRQTIANIERGNYSPSVHLALDICRELGKSVEEIFGAEQHD